MTQKKWIESKISEGLSNSQLYQMYRQFKDATGANTSFENYKSLVRKVARKNNPKTVGAVKLKTEVDGANTSIVSESSEIRTLDQLLAYTRTDLEKYYVTKHVVNSWGSSDNPSYQVKAWLTLRETEEETDVEVLNALIEDAKHYAPKYPAVRQKKAKSGNALEVSLFDCHFGQLSWGKETGDRNYNLNIAANMAMDSLSDILNEASHHNIEKIIIPIGNDFFNVNDKTNTTVKGTPQSEDDRWQKTFVTGRELWVHLLEMCRGIAPVSALWVPGNHDEERSFYLCDSLHCWFNNSDIEIDNSPSPQKVVTWGKTSVMYTHGCNERKNDYPTVFATKFPNEFATAKYRAIHLGDKHHLNKSALTVAEDVYSVDVKIKPSLVPLNAWSAGKAYKAIARTEAEIWNKEDGLIADLYHNA